jgi:hexulose-6-phosphate isomerase
VHAIRDQVDRAGLAVPSIASVLPFIYPLSSPDEATRSKGVAVVSKALEFGEILGCESVLVIPGIVGQGSPYDVAMEQLARSIEDLIPVAERHGITLALENVWNQFLLSPLEFRDLLDRFDSSRVKAYFDVGNIVRTGFGEHWIEVLGERIDKVHFCNFRGEVGNITGFTRHLLDGDVNWPGVMAALAKIGYDGWTIAEITPPSPHYPGKVILDISTTMDWILGGGDPAVGGGGR